MKHPAYFSSGTSFAIAVALGVFACSATAGAAAGSKSRICVVLPTAQLGQGGSGTDVAEPVRQTLMAYLEGPATELVLMTARIPVQIDAEAQQSGCVYVLYTSVTQKKRGGFSKLLSVAAPIASVLPVVSGSGGNYGAMMATQAAVSIATQSAQQEAMAALTGATKENIRKGDQVTLEYKLMKSGLAEPIATKSSVAKAGANGQDLLSPLIEQTAIEVMTAVNS